MVHNDSRELVVKSDQVRPMIEFPQWKQPKKKIDFRTCVVNNTNGSNISYTKMLHFASLADVSDHLVIFEFTL